MFAKAKDRKKKPDVGNTTIRGSGTRKLLNSTQISGARNLPTLDASAISVHNSNGGIKNNSNPYQSFLSSTQIFSQPKKTDKAKEDNSKKVYLLYVEYLQCKLLESSAIDTLEKRTKACMERILHAYSLLDQHLSYQAGMDKQILTYSFLHNMGTHCQTQQNMLLPVLDKLTPFQKQYDEISSAVRVVRQSLEVKSISLSDTNNEEIVSLLNRAQQLFVSIVSFVNKVQSVEEVVKSAQDAKFFLDEGSKLVREIKRVNDDIETGNNLVFEEAYEKIQLLKLNEDT